MRFLTFLHYNGIEAHFIFQNFLEPHTVLQTWVRSPGSRLHKHHCSLRGEVWAIRVASQLYIIHGDSPLSQELLRNTRRGSGPGGTRLGGCYCFCLYCLRDLSQVPPNSAFLIFLLTNSGTWAGGWPSSGSCHPRFCDSSYTLINTRDTLCATAQLVVTERQQAHPHWLHGSLS